ncbi:MAG: hypothetical protein JNM00_16065 [Flavobacteriales bacterium]|nr:hypothetical protein [Flavobacteriales bacterium]
MKTIILLSGICLLAAACTLKEIKGPDLPPRTTTGTNRIAYRINERAVYCAGTYGEPASVAYNRWENGHLYIIGVSDDDSFQFRYDSLQFAIAVQQADPEKLLGEHAFGPIWDLVYSTSTDPYDPHAYHVIPGTGTVLFTYASAQILAGEFSADLVHSATGEIVEIRNGWFDLRN